MLEPGEPLALLPQPAGEHVVPGQRGGLDHPAVLEILTRDAEQLRACHELHDALAAFRGEDEGEFADHPEKGFAQAGARAEDPDAHLIVITWNSG